MTFVEDVLPVIVGVLFVITGGVKVIGLRQSLEIRDHFNMSPTPWRVVGTLETAGGIGVLVGTQVAVLGLLAAIGLSVLMLGAIGSRLRVRDPAFVIAGDVVVLALAVTTAAGFAT
jgi:hypothetical protein